MNMNVSTSTLKKMYPPGTKVQLVHMDDFQAPHEGTIGIVEDVDDIGNIHVKWSNGSSLALIPNVDKFTVIKF